MEFLRLFVLIMLLVVSIGYINEKTIHKTYEIMLLLVSTVIGALLLIMAAGASGTTVTSILNDFHVFNVEDFLMDGVLCFMLFAGSCHMRLGEFREKARPLTVLALLTTFLGAVFYGLLFYGAARLLGLPFTLPMGLMFGSIVAPTDPIAATSILNKFGLPEDTSFLMEGESLLNDGVGVALFVCFSGMVRATGGGGASEFLRILVREVAGAVIVGVLVTYLCFAIFARTEDRNRQIFASLLAVATAYVICDYAECSGAIASVVCGVLFSYLTERAGEQGRFIDLTQYNGFWETVDTMLNSVLYVMLGLSFVRILQMEMVLVLSLLAILCNFVGRYLSLYLSTFLMGRLPDGYGRGGFSLLFTWGGFRGGLCIALAMSSAGMLPETVSHIVLGCTYAAVFFTTVIQGFTMRSVYARIPRK